MATISRFFQVPEQSFFLFGPRGTGKSLWARESWPGSLYLDLLDPETFRLHAAPINLNAVARECQVSARNLGAYLEILEDLLLGVRLCVFTHKARLKTVGHALGSCWWTRSPAGVARSCAWRPGTLLRARCSRTDFRSS